MAAARCRCRARSSTPARPTIESLLPGGKQAIVILELTLDPQGRRGEREGALVGLARARRDRAPHLVPLEVRGRAAQEQAGEHRRHRHGRLRAVASRTRPPRRDQDEVRKRPDRVAPSTYSALVSDPTDTPVLDVEALRARAPVARRALRRTLLHRRAHDADLLPAGLPGEAAARAQRRVLPHRGGRRRSRVPPLPALSPEAEPGHPRLVRRARDRRPRAAADRRRVARRRSRRSAGSRAARGHPAPSAAAVPAAPRRRAARGDPHPPRSHREASARRDRPRHGDDRVRRRLRQRAPLQRDVPRSLRPHAARAAARPRRSVEAARDGDRP